MEIPGWFAQFETGNGEIYTRSIKGLLQIFYRDKQNKACQGIINFNIGIHCFLSRLVAYTTQITMSILIEEALRERGIFERLDGRLIQ